MINKIIISVLGIFFLVGFQVFLNLVIFEKDQIFAIAISPIFAIVYATYIFLIIKKYLKL